MFSFGASAAKASSATVEAGECAKASEDASFETFEDYEKGACSEMWSLVLISPPVPPLTAATASSSFVTRCNNNNAV